MSAGNRPHKTSGRQVTHALCTVPPLYHVLPSSSTVLCSWFQFHLTTLILSKTGSKNNKRKNLIWQSSKYINLSVSWCKHILYILYHANAYECTFCGSIFCVLYVTTNQWEHKRLYFYIYVYVCLIIQTGSAGLPESESMRVHCM